MKITKTLALMLCIMVCGVTTSCSKGGNELANTEWTVTCFDTKYNLEFLDNGTEVLSFEADENNHMVSGTSQRFFDKYIVSEDKVTFLGRRLRFMNMNLRDWENFDWENIHYYYLLHGTIKGDTIVLTTLEHKRTVDWSALTDTTVIIGEKEFILTKIWPPLQNE